METTCIFVADEPNSLKSNEMYIPPLPFVSAVKACEKQKGNSVTLRPNYLRAVATEIGRRYDRMFNPFRHVVPSDFEGVPASSDEDVAAVVETMFKSTYPQIFSKYIESSIKDRPYGVNTIYIGENRFEKGILSKLGVREVAEVLKTLEPATQSLNAESSRLVEPESEAAKTLESLVAESTPELATTDTNSTEIAKPKKTKAKK